MKSEDDLRDKVRKLLGKPPYDTPSNICWNDNYFSKSIEQEYGEIAFAKMIKEES